MFKPTFQTHSVQTQMFFMFVGLSLSRLGNAWLTRRRGTPAASRRSKDVNISHKSLPESSARSQICTHLEKVGGVGWWIHPGDAKKRKRRKGNDIADMSNFNVLREHLEWAMFGLTS